MTVLATTMGCAFLIVLASVGFGLQKSAVNEIEKQQILTEISVAGKEKDGKKEAKVGPSEIQNISNVDGVKAVVHRIFIGTDNPETSPAITFKNRKSNDIRPFLTDMKEETKADLTLEKGRLPKSPDEIVVGYHFGKTLLTEKEKAAYLKHIQNPDTEDSYQDPKGFTGNLLNQTVSLDVVKMINGKKETKTYPFKIVGIAKKPSLEYVMDTNILISDKNQPAFEAFTGEKKTKFDELNAYASSIDQVEDISNTLKEKGYLVDSISERVKGMNVFFNVFKIGLIFVGTIAVLIASIGIFNTMTMAVTERTQEIGIMKAIGAQPKIIKRIFLMESAWIGILGSVIGIFISYGISMAANQIIPMILSSTAGSKGFEMTFSYIPPSLVLISAVISIGVAILSGMRPAAKATRINVLSALRREM